MRAKTYCPVCQLDFVIAEENFFEGSVVLCRICGAKIEITAVGPTIEGRKWAQKPEEEIVERVDTFASLRGYVFNEHRELVMEGLMGKHELYGDFYCPCRFENTAETLCPCLEARKNYVKKHGECRCGLFVLPG